MCVCVRARTRVWVCEREHYIDVVSPVCSQKPVNNRHKTPTKSEMKTEQSLTAEGAMTKTRYIS